MSTRSGGSRPGSSSGSSIGLEFSRTFSAAAGWDEDDDVDLGASAGGLRGVLGRLSPQGGRPRSVGFGAEPFPTKQTCRLPRHNPCKEESIQTVDYSGLHNISAVASAVSGDLAALIERCANDELACEVESLRTIAAAASCIDMAATERAPAMESGRGAKEVAEKVVAAPAPYSDARLSRARLVIAHAQELCEDLDARTACFGMATREAAERDALRHISEATQRVREDMSSLQKEPWAETPQPATAPTASADAAPGKAADSRVGTASTSATDGQEEADEALQAPSSADGTDDARSSSPDPRTRRHRRRSAIKSLSGIKKQGTLNLAKVEGLPDVQDILGHTDGSLSASDAARMEAAFRRFKVPDGQELHVDDVKNVLDYLGHVFATDENVEKAIKATTSFDYLDFEEFLALEERFMQFEREQCHRVFKEFDIDNSGNISVDELKSLLSELGFIPLSNMMKEALAMVDKDGDGELNFPELVQFLRVYRRAEGFSALDALEFRRIFDLFSAKASAAPGVLPADQLADALVQAFGLHVSTIATELETKVTRSGGLRKSSAFRDTDERGVNLSFQEFMIFARKVREASLDQLRSTFPAFKGGDFEQFDADGSGGINQEELRNWLRHVGYTPLRQNVTEIFAEVDKDSNCELDITELFDFMMIYCQREGFRSQHVQDMRMTFERFDTDGVGEINTLQLADLFRELGYSCTLEQLHAHVSEVDVNGSNRLDFREFMRLMRLHREEELLEINTVFERFKTSARRTLSAKDLKAALRALGHDGLPKVHGLKELRELDFDSFVNIADACRTERVAKERKYAGFTEDQIRNFRKIYDRFDADGSGEIDTTELMGVLKVFRWEPKTREEQKTLLAKFDAARKLARYAGVEDVCEDGSGAIDFWTFVQLSRMLESDLEASEEKLMSELMAELKFTIKDVEEFRQVYNERKRLWSEQRGKVSDKEPAGLPSDAIYRLMNFLGLSLPKERKIQLDEQLDALGSTPDAGLDFPGFLRLMRWLMESGWLEDAQRVG